jgi:flagellar motility protein MotE (MotC chaperone)
LINPRRMSEILSAMSPEIAEKLTMELSMRAGAADRAEGANLPKIQGRPSGG